MQSGVTLADRAVAYGHKGHVVWLTGVPGVGKSTLARYLERELFDRHVKTFVLDGENLRFGLSADLGFTDADRSEQARRAGEVARLFRLAGFVVIVALVSPFDADREYARTLVGHESFSLIHLEALPAILRERDPHGLYSRVAGGAAVAVPGLNSPYEPPVGAALQVDTGGESIQASGARILGVNNRDLRTFQVDLAVSLRLADKIPSGVIKVTESGINTADDVRQLRAAGYNSFLVGEHLMQSGDPARALQTLLS